MKPQMKPGPFKFEVGDRVYSKDIHHGCQGQIQSRRVSKDDRQYNIYDVRIEIPWSRNNTAHTSTFFFGEWQLSKRKPRKQK